jgi:hypothetical protein
MRDIFRDRLHERNRGMQIRHPFAAIPHGQRRHVFLPLAALTLVSMGGVIGLNLRLETSVAPHGILSLQFAGSVAQARQIVESWDETARLYAALDIGLDFLALCAYSTTLAFLCVWAAEVLRGRGLAFVALGLLLAWGQWLAGLLDAVENVANFITLLGSGDESWPRLAWWCAGVKFSLVAAGLVYTILGVVIALWFTFIRRQNS